MNITQRLQPLIAATSRIKLLDLGWTPDNHDTWTNEKYPFFVIRQKSPENFVVSCRGYRGPIKFTTTPEAAHKYVGIFKQKEEQLPLADRYGGALVTTKEDHYRGLQSWVQDYINYRKAGNIKDAKNLYRYITRIIKREDLDPKRVWGRDPDAAPFLKRLADPLNPQSKHRSYK